MAFSFANASTNNNLTSGPEIEEITTEQLGFTSIGGGFNLKLLPSPWTTTSLPPPTSSLLSIASSRGLLAAAAPESLVLASTESVRKALNDKQKDFSPQLTLSVPRVSQLTFTSDDRRLVLSAESGGGLAVYDTDALLQNQKEPSFQITTESIAIRTLAPNPAEENANFVAVVLTGGQLMLADLENKQFVNGANGTKVLKENVSCVTWSVKGKQMVVGLADGTGCQLDPTGNVKATIPVAQGLEGAHHISTLVWLSNDEFLIVYTPNNSDDPERAPESTLFFVKTNPGRTSWTFSKVPMDPAPPFGLNRTPPSHFVNRLRNWHHLTDTLILSSVASPDVGLFTKADQPLSSDFDADKITNVYTTTSFAQDSRRAVLPTSITDDVSDTSPIGMTLDLSAKELVPRPIPGDDMEDSPFPLPAMMLLNNEGYLSAWWVVYNTALRDNKPYTAMNEIAHSAPSSGANATSLTSPQASATPSNAFGGGFGKGSAPAFGSSGFGALGAAQPGLTAFGSAGSGSKASPWGSSTGSATSGGSAFGQQGGFGALASGAKTSPWGTSAPAAVAAGPAPSFGQSAFGASSSSGGGFGALSNMGQKASPWAAKSGDISSTATAATPNTTFGQTAFGKAASSTASPFAAMSTGNSPFGQQTKPSQSAFGPSSSFGQGSSFGMTPQPSFGSTVTIDSSTGGSTGSKSLFGAPSAPSGIFSSRAAAPEESKEDDMMDDDSDETSASGQAKEDSKTNVSQKPSTAFGMGSGGFAMPNNSKADGAAKSSGGQVEAGPGSSLFGSGFAAALDLSESASHTSTETLSKPPSNLFGFGSQSTSANKSGPETNKATNLPEPPQVTSKPIASPVTVTTTSSKPPSEEDDLPPLAGDSPVEVSVPDSPSASSEDSSAERGKESPKPIIKEEPKLPSGKVSANTDAPLPPNPFKVKKPVWFNEPIPGAASAEEKTIVKKEVVDDAPPPAPLPPNPYLAKKPAWFNEVPPGAASFPAVAPAVTPARGTLFGEITNKVHSTPTAENTQQLPKPTFSLFGATPTKQVPPPAPTPPVASPLFKDSSTTPAGLPPAPINFQPMSASIRQSPRSPSPVRSTSTPLLNSTGGRPPIKVPSGLREQPPKATPVTEQPPPATAEDLVDDEDDRIRHLLDEPVEPQITLAPFVAHQDYAGESELKGVPGHCERVYRDINSMLDTLGLNSRSLACFIEGQSLDASEDKELEDLDDPEEWTLVEAGALAQIEAHLEEDIEETRLSTVPATLANLGSMRKELVRVRADLSKAKQYLDREQDPIQMATQRSAKLDPIHAAKQRELRIALSTFQTKLAEAEDAVLVLRTKLASLSAKAGGSATAAGQPTYEAIENTIRKMIRMTQEKSSDVDVLESQMRKLGLAAPPSREGTPLRESVRLSLRDPQRFGSPLRNSTNGTNSLRNSLILTPQKQVSTPVKAGQKEKPRGFSADVESSGDEDEERVYEEARRSVLGEYDDSVRMFLEKRKARKGVEGKIRDGVLRRAAASAKSSSS